MEKNPYENHIKSILIHTTEGSPVRRTWFSLADTVRKQSEIPDSCWKFTTLHQKWGKTKLIGSRTITTEFDNKSFWKFTTALGRKLSDGRLFFTKLFPTVEGTTCFHGANETAQYTTDRVDSSGHRGNVCFQLQQVSSRSPAGAQQVPSA